MTIINKINQLGYELPIPPKPVGSYIPAVRTGSLIFTSGQLPFKDGELIATGKVPTDISIEDAQAAARQALLNALAVIAREAGSLEAITQVVRLNVFVNSAAGFTDQAKVADAASELLTDIMGSPGKHTRCTIGSVLPLNAPVELDMVVQVTD